MNDVNDQDKERAMWEHFNAQKQEQDLSKLSEPLPIEQIEFRIQSINMGGYATVLAYKDARVDMNRLDEVVGSLYWKREMLDNNRRCRVSIYNKALGEWISKEDVGTPSQTEAEKGLASDSFKRACFNFGIGRELYDYPQIQIKLEPNEFKIESGRAKATFDLKIKDWVWYSEFNNGKLSYLGCKYNGKVRFQWGTLKAKK